ncbi:DEAD/DEAH box helicase [Thermococcus aggregans]|uniref:ATP-dependent DNA helicase Hel308 n=1 Tax=Thermococcus aggregans TaxID=110163 RepID=A0A9E7MXA3_THEAG|nr:DEAD/DEAH box helicase [Thermococcus aggregans]USS40636.1 DEAD/DEAH box helicase [Thermococcus aggregans]
MRVEELKSLGVDERIIKLIKERGIEELYPPQEEALRTKVLKGGNLILSIPTASGKTLVAEIVMVNKILQEGGKAVYLVPLKALAEEKYKEFKFWEKLGIRVGMTTGDYDSADEWLGKYDIIIATSEKFDSLLRHKSPWIRDVKLIVADEVHLLGSYDRGATLEMILSHMMNKAQILGLSATIGNAEELAEWLNAELVVSEWRPVKLKRGVFYHGQLFWEDGKIEKFPSQWDSLIIDVLKKDKQALVFVNTRRSAEKEALLLGGKVRRFLSKPEERKLNQLADELTNDRLKEALRKGVAFHHAGLSREERSIVEDAFREGLIKVITATPTLCMHPHTYVITKNGAKKVSELKEGDEVLTHTGAFKKVIQPLKRYHKGKLLVIKACGTIPVKVTPEHRIWVIKQIKQKEGVVFEGPSWLTAQELKEKLESEKDPKVSYALLQPIPEASIKVDKIPLENNNDNKENASKCLPLNLETARLIGLWTAKGLASKNGVVKFTIKEQRDEIADFLMKATAKYFPHAKTEVEGGEIHLRDKHFAEWLLENIGNEAHQRKIPNALLFNENREVRLGLLWGLIDGSEGVNIRTTSPSIAYQIQLLVASLGYVSSVDVTGKAEEPVYTITLADNALLEELGFKAPPKDNREYNENQIWDKYLLLKVHSIEEEDYSGEVYNLEVEEDESYSVGFVVHNSAGVNLPAYRVIIRDTKRYSNFGWSDIPVLEVQQMMGRAGRPKYDKEGQAIIVAKTEKPEDLMKKYIFGKPEKLFSMLSNEASFRSQVLALITNFGVRNFKELIEFLEKTFYYHQRKNLEALEGKAKDIVYFLLENEFIDIDLNDQFVPLPFGIRTSQLYLDPLTAKKFRDAFGKLEENPNALGIFHLLASTPDMASLRIRRKEQEDILDYAYEMEGYLYQDIPYWEDYKFEKFLGEVKTAKMLLDWINEVPETKILEVYDIDAGDLYRILELADWLMYSLIELYKLSNPKMEVLDFLKRLHLRVKYGVREELLELTSLPMIGRKRARALYNAGFKSVEDIIKAKPSELLRVEGIGVGILEKIYQHFGVELPNVKEKKKARKGTLDEFFK